MRARFERRDLLGSGQIRWRGSNHQSYPTRDCRQRDSADEQPDPITCHTFERLTQSLKSASSDDPAGSRTDESLPQPLSMPFVQRRYMNRNHAALPVVMKADYQLES